MDSYYESIKFTDKHHSEIADLFDYSELTAEEVIEVDSKFTKYLADDDAPRYIYIIRCEDTNLYKIGITNNLKKRLATHQTGCPYELKLICYAEADMSDFLGREIAYIEDFLHVNYEKLNVRGEWFKLEYSHLSDIVMFLELNRELGVCICSELEFSYYYKRLMSVPDE